MKKYKLAWGFIFGSLGFFISSALSFVIIFVEYVDIFNGGKK
jgi:hypothetical protein